MLNFGNKEFRNLQEQVLKNAQDIEILKERPGIKPVVVNELPAVGEEGILYLVPKNPDPDTSDADSYDEYIWLPETQTYEFVGSTALNISNMVTTDTEQTITGAKTFSAIANFNSGLNANEITLGTGMSIKNHDQASSNYIDLIQGNSRAMAIGSTIYSYVNFLPGASGTMNLGSDTMRWNALYLSGQINFSTGPAIKQDSSNRIVITEANGAERIKIGTDKSTYCAANWTPDEDNKYLLGTAQLRWKTINVGAVLNPKDNLLLRGNPNINVALGNNTEDGAINPSSNNKFTIGTTSKLWKAVYTTTIGDATKSVNVADIATKPNFDSPTAYASGTIDSNGQCTIDIATLGVPTPGLYAFHYNGAQCYVTFTTSNIQNAGATPIIVSCPVLKDNTQYAGCLKITRNADILTITIDSSAGPVSPQGMPWSIYKVM